MTTFNPIFPPEEINASPESIKRSMDALDDNTKEYLTQYNAKLAQASAIAALMIGKELNLSSEAAKELTSAFVKTAGELLPSYHDYVNKLLGCVALAFSSQEKETEAVETKEEDTPGIELKPEEAVLQPIEPIVFNNGDRLLFYEKPNKISKFADRLLNAHPEIPTEDLDVQSKSLIVWQAIDFYRSFYTTGQKPENKEKQIRRTEKYFGLYEKSKTCEEIAAEEGVSTAAIYQGLDQTRNRVIEANKPNLANFVQRAKVTLVNTSVDNIFKNN